MNNVQSSVITGFYRVFLGFVGLYLTSPCFFFIGSPGMYSVLLGYRRFSRVLLSFTEFFMFISRIYWVLLSFIGLYLVLLDFLWICWLEPIITGFLLGFPGIHSL